MIDRDQNTTTAARAASDAEVEALISSGAAGVDTALRALESAEQVYYGAVAATESPPVITVTAVSPYSPDATP
jgi:hypothetical protein